MRHSFDQWFAKVLVLAFTISLFWANASGQTESLLYSFTGLVDGGGPQGSLIFDSAGNLYGTTGGGGACGSGHGVVYELTPVAGGGWAESVLYAFTGGSDGSVPIAGLVLDATGNLYGTTEQGGTYGYGTVFELSPVSGGGWTEQVVHSFSNGWDGSTPTGALVFDTAGNLYGTCVFSGAHGQGVVYELSPATGGAWAFNVILAGDITHGGVFNGSVVFDGNGSLYAVASSGGSAGLGAIYRLRLTSVGWKANVIYTFLNGVEGASPGAGLIYSVPNRLFGVNSGGGIFGYGAAFELTQQSGTWTKKILHSFGAGPNDGRPVLFRLTLGSSGQLYGVTGAGGSAGYGTAGYGTAGYGTAFELVEKGGVWREEILHNFTRSSDSGNPGGGLVLDSAGNLYGEGNNGGDFQSGAVYEIVP